MNFWQRLNPSNPPEYLSHKSELDIYRERVLQTILITGFGIAVILYLQVILTFFTQQNTFQLAYSTVFLAGLGFLVNYRKANYQIKAAVVLILLFTWSITSFLESGISGPSFIVLLTTIVLAAILLGQTASIIALIASTLIILFFSAGMAEKVFPLLPPWAPMETQDLISWTRMGLNFLLLAVVITISMGFLINGLKTGLERQSKLANDIEGERLSLEQHIQERTQELEKRLQQIRTAADISRTTSSVLDQQFLLQRVVDMIQDGFNLYYVGVFLIDKTNQFAVLRAGTGAAGQKMMADGHRLAIGGSSMIGWTTLNQKARIALDVGSEAVRFNNPHLPNTRSELAIPILNQSKTLGALTIQSDQANAFDDEDILVLQGIADSLAIALDNASLFQQNQEDLDEIKSLNRQYINKAWTEVMDIYGSLNYSYENVQTHQIGSAEVINFPITLREQSIGTIAIEADADHPLSVDDKEMVSAILTQTALTLESARLLAETQRKAVQEEKLNELSTNFSHTMSVEEILKVALVELGQLPVVSEVAVHLLPAEDQEEVASQKIGTRSRIDETA